MPKAILINNFKCVDLAFSPLSYWLDEAMSYIILTEELVFEEIVVWYMAQMYNYIRTLRSSLQYSIFEQGLQWPGAVRCGLVYTSSRGC